MPSTVIASIAYDPATNNLTITFVSGLAYTYLNVPQDIYNSFINYREKGVYFNQYIKNKYSFRRNTATS
jgi:hypothetical protein